MICNLRECLFVCVRLLECIFQLQNTFQLTSYPPKAVKVCIVKVRGFHRTSILLHVFYPPKLLFKQMGGTIIALLVLFWKSAIRLQIMAFSKDCFWNRTVFILQIWKP